MANQQRQTTRDLYRHTSIAEMARERAEQTPDDIAFFFDDGSTLKYGDIYREACQLAAGLRQLGCEVGDVVSFQLPNCRESVIIDVAAALAGLILNPIIPIYRDKEVSYILKDTAAKVLFIPAQYRRYDYIDLLRRLLPDLTALKKVVVVGSSETASLNTPFTHYHDVANSAVEQGYEFGAVDPDSVKTLLYTSGTTGNPKAVRHSHNTFTRALDNGVEAWQLGEGDVMLMPSPVTHITGLANGIELPFFTRCKTVFMDLWDVNVAIDLIQRLGVTVCLSATPFLQELVSRCKALNMGLPSLRLFASGGASVPPNLIYEAHQVFERCRAFRVYGSTEAPLVTVGFQALQQEQLAAETDGRPFNWEIRIESDEGRILPSGEDGEILVKGPALMLGYGDDRQTEQVMAAEGFFRTGDIGHINSEGAIVITDRKKDIIIRGGENLSAREIEDVLHQHPDISQAAVVAVPHERLGEGVCAVLVPGSKSSTLSLEEIRPFLQQSGLAKQKWPECIELRDSLPMTASGKVKKDVLRASLGHRAI